MISHDIFLSYSSKEKAVADGVCHYLEENGVKCWMAPRDIPPGSDYGDLIDSAILGCKCVVMIYSHEAFVSKWVKGEINVAFSEGKSIIPFRIDPTEIKGAFKVMLNQVHWIEAYPRYANRLPDLLRSITNIIGSPPKKPQTIPDPHPTPQPQPNPSKKWLWITLSVLLLVIFGITLYVSKEKPKNNKAESVIEEPMYRSDVAIDRDDEMFNAW